jgi:hypothetical protein
MCARFISTPLKLQFSTTTSPASTRAALAIASSTALPAFKVTADLHHRA